MSQKTPKVSQKGAKGSQKGATWRPKGAKSEPRADQSASKSQGCEKYEKREHPYTIRRSIFGTIFHQKPKKWHPQSHPKIDAEKVTKSDAKRLQNDDKIDAKINDVSYFFEKG